MPALAADIVEKLIEGMSLLLTNPILLLQYRGRICPPHLEKPFNIQEICLWDRLIFFMSFVCEYNLYVTFYRCFLDLNSPGYFFNLLDISWISPGY